MKYKYAIAILAGLFVVFFIARFKFSPVTPIQSSATSTPTSVTPTRSDSINMLFVGDIMLDRTVRTTIDKKGFEYPFTDIKSIFQGTDLAVGNLEGTITSNRSISENNYKILKFTFASSVTKGLKDLGFSGFTLANNHSKDFGTDGFLETMANIGVGGLFSFGSPSNDINLSTVQTIKDQKICLVGYHALYDPNTQSVEKEIIRLRSGCDFIVVFAHWGTEYSEVITKLQETEAHEFIDAGADLVVGAHPHVIEPVEIYKNKAIFYSLGNFIFDQDFSLATRQGLAVRMELSKREITYHLIGLEMYKNKLSFPEKERFQNRTEILISRLPADLKERADIDGLIVLQR